MRDISAEERAGSTFSPLVNILLFLAVSKINQVRILIILDSGVLQMFIYVVFCVCREVGGWRGGGGGAAFKVVSATLPELCLCLFNI